VKPEHKMEYNTTYTFCMSLSSHIHIMHTSFWPSPPKNVQTSCPADPAGMHISNLHCSFPRPAFHSPDIRTTPESFENRKKNCI
jgi:hypothetical protein